MSTLQTNTVISAIEEESCTDLVDNPLSKESIVTQLVRNSLIAYQLKGSNETLYVHMIDLALRNNITTAGIKSYQEYLGNIWISCAEALFEEIGTDDCMYDVRVHAEKVVQLKLSIEQVNKQLKESLQLKKDSSQKIRNNKGRKRSKITNEDERLKDLVGLQESHLLLKASINDLQKKKTEIRRSIEKKRKDIERVMEEHVSAFGNVVQQLLNDDIDGSLNIGAQKLEYLRGLVYHVDSSHQKVSKNVCSLPIHYIC